MTYFSSISWKLLLPLAFAAALFSGCATAPLTYKLNSDADAKIPKLKTVVAPLDVELAELPASGVIEQRDDWTTEAVKNLDAALTEETGWHAPKGLTAQQDAALKAESSDVQSLLRAITLNQLNARFVGPNAPNGFPYPKEMTYDVGPLKEHAAVLGNGAVLFVFVRSSYATAGRKALLGLSLLGAGLTGIAVIPAMGGDVVSAALVDTDGTVLWFNMPFGGADARTAAGAQQLAKQLLQGLPKHTS